jgi:hypothetical protein
MHLRVSGKLTALPRQPKCEKYLDLCENRINIWSPAGSDEKIADRSGRRDLHWPGDAAGQPMDTYHRWMDIVVPASLIGLPTLSVPVGFGPGGLPMGMQLIARRGQDGTLLGLGQSYHERTLWPQSNPPRFPASSPRSRPADGPTNA